MAGIDQILDLLDVGIRAEGLRQQAIASNIANAQTPGYRRVDVRFEQVLEKALRSGRQLDIESIEPQVYRPGGKSLGPTENDVSLEQEVGQMVKNSIRQRAFIRILARKYQQIAQAMDTGQH